MYINDADHEKGEIRGLVSLSLALLARNEAFLVGPTRG